MTAIAHPFVNVERLRALAFATDTLVDQVATLVDEVGPSHVVRDPGARADCRRARAAVIHAQRLLKETVHALALAERHLCSAADPQRS